MPIYEYRCDACGESLEKLQKMSDDPLKTCPQCNKETLKKQISAVGFRLKGSGWYETDFKKSKKNNATKTGNNAPEKSKPQPKPKNDKNN